MIRWVIRKLASVLPPALDADSKQMRFSTTQKRLFLRETRFLFLSDRGPVELAVRPGPVLVSLCGGLSLIGLVMISPALPVLSGLGLSGIASLPALPTLSSLPSLPPLIADKNQQAQATGLFSSVFGDGFVATLLDNQSPEPTTAASVFDLPSIRLSEPPRQTQTTLAARRPGNFTNIDEPSDELILGPVEEQTDIAAPSTKTQASIAAPAARPLPEPMDREFVGFDGLSLPPLPSERVKLHRRFANTLAEVERIEAMLNKLGISPDDQPEAWDNTLVPDEQYVPALYLYRDNWRELLHLIPLKAPLRYYYVTSPYGMRTNKKTGVRRFHHGVDLAGTWKAQLRPSASGVVTFAGRDGGFGKVVRIQHAHGIETVYAHLSSILVSKGSFVTSQDILGTMGNTGHSDGMHLHYEIRIRGKSKDPEDFFTFGHKLTVTGALAGEL